MKYRITQNGREVWSIVTAPETAERAIPEALNALSGNVRAEECKDGVWTPWAGQINAAPAP